MEKVKLLQTCGSCPEAYDAYVGDRMIGYLRLRHGHFNVVFYGKDGHKSVYSAEPSGPGGMFREEESERYLTAASHALLDALAHEEEGTRERPYEFISEPPDGR